MDRNRLAGQLGDLFGRLVRSPAGPLPVPLREEAVDIARVKDNGLRADLQARGDIPARDLVRFSNGLPEDRAAAAARPAAAAGEVRQAFEDAGRAAPRMMAALTRQVPRTRSAHYVAEVVALAVETGRIPALRRMAVLPHLTVPERVAVLTALDREVLDRGPLACGQWLDDLVRDLEALMSRHLPFSRAVLPQLQSTPLLRTASAAGLPDDEGTHERICLTLLACVRDDGTFPSPHGDSPAAAADKLTELLPAVSPRVATVIRDSVLTGPWPAMLRAQSFANSLGHLETLAPHVVCDVPWQSALTYPDAFGHLADPLADLLRVELGDDSDRWHLLARYSRTFTGTVRELLDVITGVADTTGATGATTPAH